MKRVVVVVAFAATASCNAVLGLEEPTIVANDAAIVADTSSDDTARVDTAVAPDSMTDGPVVDSAPPPAEAEVACSSTYRALVAASGPVATWRLDDTAMPVAEDSAGGTPPLPGTYYGDVRFGFPGALACDPGTAVRFNSGNARVEIDDTPAYSGTTAFSVEFWVKLDAVATTPTYLVGRQTGGVGFLLTATTAGVLFQRSDPGLVTHEVTVGPFTAGAWHHVVGVFTGMAMLVYLDGISAVKTSSLTHGPAAKLTIASPSATAPASFAAVGSFDEVALYNDALPADQVLAHFDAGIGK